MFVRTLFLLILTAGLVAGCADDPVDLRLEVVSLEVGPTGRVIAVGDTVRLAAYPRMADSTVLGSAGVEWSVEDPTVAELDPDGQWVRVRGLRPGAARVTARSEGKVASATVTITPLPPTVAGISVTPGESRVVVGGQTQLSVTVHGSDGTLLGGYPVTWSSSEPTVATVHGDAAHTLGVVTVHRGGTARISASAAGFTATVTVVGEAQAPEVWYLLVSPNRRAIWQGESFQLGATAIGPNGTSSDHPFVWTVEDTTIAQVNGSGMVRGRSVGETRVFVRLGGVTESATIRVRSFPTEPFMADLQPGIDPVGAPRVLVPVDSVTWTDEQGVEHRDPLYLTGGTLKHFRDGDRLRYEQVRTLSRSAYDPVRNAYTLVDVRRDVEQGDILYRLFDGAYLYDADDDAGDPYAAVWAEAGRLVVEQEIGLMQTIPYVYLLR